jgi:predicted dehydrogenase
MRRIKYGIVGVGFVGPHHIEAVRRLGFADIAAVADANLELAKSKAEALHVGNAYGSYEELCDDPGIDVVDIATPTYLHHRIAMAAIAKGKHVIVDKPMAVTASEAREMRDAARRAGVTGAVTFNYRYNPLVQHMRAMIRGGEVGEIHFVHGRYLQEWLLYPTDFSWRLEPDKAGQACVSGDAGAHWYDLVQHVTGLRITAVLADLNTMIKRRKKPLSQWREAFSAAGAGETEDFDVKVDDLANVVLRFDNGASGNFLASQICAGHKNDLRVEFNGSKCSLAWQEERENELWIGRRGEPNQILMKEPGTLNEAARGYAKLPGGHNEAWPDAFRNLMGNILSHIAEGKGPAANDDLFPTFDTGVRIAAVVDALLESQAAGSRWTEVKA